MSSEARQGSELADMAVTRAEASVGLAAATRPTGPVSRFIAWVDTLPWHGWWVYPGIALAMLAWGQAVLWASGQVPVGELDPRLAVLLPYGPYSLGGLALGRLVGQRALVDFWPATGWPDRDRAAWSERFATPPAGWESMALLIGGVVGIASMIAAPAAVLGPAEGSVVNAIAYAPAYVMGYSVGAAATVIVLRWMLTITRIHREAGAIDPFDPGPIHAFSRVTVTVGLSIVLVVYYSFSVNAAAQTDNIPSLAFLGALMFAGAAAFVAPLWGIHQRLVRLKGALMKDVEQRRSLTVTELYARIDAGDFAATETVEHALTALTVQRARVADLPTWPWSPQLFRGFVSALVLPIVLFVLTRAVTVILEG